MIEPPKPPSPPKFPRIEQAEDKKEKPKNNVFDELGMTQREFAEEALNSSTEWNIDQLDELQTLLDGEGLEEEQSRDLIDEFMNIPEQDSIKTTIQERKVSRDMMDPEELAEELAEAPSIGMMGESHIPYQVPESRVNLDDWIKNK